MCEEDKLRKVETLVRYISPVFIGLEQLWFGTLVA
ncbi:hypothetical protein SLEP1_g12277 [Rubroshorea leprosula]|uniref:Uncharacterized protein n=1 Tax=Rubroshorea leprosula TaxID=152421 RepID=A0AAV5IGH2_9ROSI|nr:hypothetical protein SLEP1_g12277 [Rubroshorea leprosula]